MRTVITATEVPVILAMAKMVGDADRLARKTNAEVWNYTKITAKSLDRLSRYGVASDVRLSADALAKKLWFIFKATKARHAELKAAALNAEVYTTASECTGNEPEPVEDDPFEVTEYYTYHPEPWPWALL
jgi:hypothetical protein